MRTWILIAAFVLTAASPTPSWRLLGSLQAIKDPNPLKGPTWQVHVDNRSIERTQKYVQANLWSEFANAPQCYPSRNDCIERILHTYDTIRFFCNGQAQLVATEMVRDPSWSDKKAAPPKAGLMMTINKAEPTLLSIAERELCKR